MFNCMCVLEGICLSPVIYKIFNHVIDKEKILFFTCIHCNHSLEKIEHNYIVIFILLERFCQVIEAVREKIKTE